MGYKSFRAGGAGAPRYPFTGDSWVKAKMKP